MLSLSVFLFVTYYTFLELVDKSIGSRISIITKSDTEFIGTLQGFDEYLSMALEDVIELFSFLLPYYLEHTQKMDIR